MNAEFSSGMDGARGLWVTCRCCGDDFPAARAELGYGVCLPCGEALAREKRKSWTVVQEFGKGPYQYVSSEAAARTLKDTNQKATRS